MYSIPCSYFLAYGQYSVLFAFLLPAFFYTGIPERDLEDLQVPCHRKALWWELFLKAEVADLGIEIHMQFVKEEAVCHLHTFFKRLFNLGNSCTYTSNRFQDYILRMFPSACLPARVIYRL